MIHTNEQTKFKGNDMTLTDNYERNNNKRKKRSVIKILILIILLLALFYSAIYLIGRIKYKNKFFPNTIINGVDISEKTLEEAAKLMPFGNNPENLELETIYGKTVSIPLDDFDFTFDLKQTLKIFYDEQNYATWFLSSFSKNYVEFKQVIPFNREKLLRILKNTSWGDEITQDAKIELTDNGYVIIPEIQGAGEIDFENLVGSIQTSLYNEEFKVNIASTESYIPPKVKENDLKDELKTLQKIFNTYINYDFDYTTEKLTGKQLIDLINIDSRGKITADRKKCEKYIESLAKKYDTYNTERKFKATLQGNITIPTGSDARYGWWIYKEKMCDELVELLEKGKSVEKANPVYYSEDGFDYIGFKSARSEKDDIGKTYVEIDLTNQKLWYYLDGKRKLECSIVSGQSSSQARITEAGVYRVWFKAPNYRMKGTNSDGETWDSNCSYWTSVSPVGIGLHDAQWRSSFGGQIYKTNGSHGCINMPLDAAKYVYDNVEFNTPVVMYY